MMAANHEAEVKNHLNKIKDLETRMNESADSSMTRFKREHRNGSGSDQIATASQRRKTVELEGVVASLQAKNIELISARAVFRKQEIDFWKKEGDSIKKDYERQLSDLRGEFFMKTNNDGYLHKTAIEGLQAQLKDQRATLTGQVFALKKELKSVTTGSEQHLKAQLTEARERESSHRETLEKERMTFEKKIDQYKSDLRRERAHVKEAQKGQEERLAGEQYRLEKELRRQAESLKVQHEQEQYRLRSAVEDLRGTLVVKEQFKCLADSGINKRFTKLAKEVEDFARLEWSAESEAHWFEQLQQLHPHNPRKLKQALVQNSAWIGPRALIFRSPSRCSRIMRAGWT